MRAPRKIKSMNVDHAAPAYQIVERFGGLKRFCELTGCKTSTVWDWLVKGLIPAPRQAHILAVAQHHRISIRPADFVPQALAA